MPYLTQKYRHYNVLYPFLTQIWLKSDSFLLVCAGGPGSNFGTAKLFRRPSKAVASSSLIIQGKGKGKGGQTLAFFECK